MKDEKITMASTLLTVVLPQGVYNDLMQTFESIIQEDTDQELVRESARFAQQFTQYARRLEDGSVSMRLFDNQAVALICFFAETLTDESYQDYAQHLRPLDKASTYMRYNRV